jgi:hypothetical protein
VVLDCRFAIAGFVCEIVEKLGHDIVMQTCTRQVLLLRLEPGDHFLTSLRRHHLELLSVFQPIFRMRILLLHSQLFFELLALDW